VLPDPKLDDRTFQDLVDEAKRLIPRYTPEWTDHNVSDPGVTLIELFAWMTDLTLYRLNRVPEKNYLRFMELLGLSLKEALPAATDVSFRLSVPQAGPIAIPSGTEVTTVRTSTQDAIGFATDEEMVLEPPRLTRLLHSIDFSTFTDQSSLLDDVEAQATPFQQPPIPGEALYLGFDNDPSKHTIELDIDCELEGLGVDPSNPPLTWEAWGGESRGWLSIRLEQDSTGGLNEPGKVLLDLPGNLQELEVDGSTKHWIRLRIIQPASGAPGYSASPRLGTISAVTVGGVISCQHSSIITNELLERSTGIVGDSRTLLSPPLLPRRDDEYLEVEETDGEWTRWTEVPSFSATGADDRHYVLDGVSGTLTFGPTIRQPNGTERAYGFTPPRGAGMRFTKYRQGGGVVGNVGADTLLVLKSSIPFVGRVFNLSPAVGGMNPETVDAAKLRVPGMLRSRDRAVTAGDFEYLAMEASRDVARARCIQTHGEDSSVPPGTVELLIVPALPEGRERTLDSLQPPPELVQEVTGFLDERRLLGTQLVVDGPAYVGVRVEASIVAPSHLDGDIVAKDVAGRITEYLDPLIGGGDGNGWPFGRPVTLSEIQSVIQSIPGVEFARDVTLLQVDTVSGQGRVAGQQVVLSGDVLVLPYEHNITVEEL
jgi:predicted phage baseplate assembly protein